MSPRPRVPSPCRLILAIAVATLLPAAAASAQGAAVVEPHVARFPIDRSPIELTNDVRPRSYVGVVSRRAAWLGEETGEAELWVHPLKLARRFRFDFRIPEYAEPIRGEDVARTIEIGPELTTIVYTHAAFTVRAHLLAPLDEPGLLALLEVDSVRPLDVIVSFQSVLQYAWPGGLGGQYVSWDETRRAFLLSESLRRHNAFIGSPWATSASSHPAHALPDAPSSFTITVDRERARREFVPVAIVAGIEPRDAVAARYRALVERAPALYRQRRDHAARLLSAGARIDTPDPLLNLAFAWARVNLDEQLVCNPDLGCGLVAGWGPSGTSLRPGFGWFFGGDAAINSLAMSSIGQFEGVAQGLRFLAKYQREDGKIAHEISQAAKRIPWFTDFPYAYYHADTTPFWILATWRYWRASGDTALVEELWPGLRKAFDWCRAQDGDGDGIMENTTAGLGAIEVGAIGEDIHQDVYLAAVWIASLEAMESLAASRGDRDVAERAGALRARARASLDDKYWLPSAGHHAFGLLRSGATNDALTVWPAAAAAFGLLDPARARRTLAALATPRISTDWGARMLAKDHALYDPTHYNMGAVWPFVTGFVAWGQYAYERPWAGLPFVGALAHLAFDWARGRHPELLSGEFYRPLDTAVPQQFFATSMLVTSLVSGMLGWSPDAPAGRALLAPQLPPAWKKLDLTLPVGTARLVGTIGREPGRIFARLRVEQGPLRLTFAPPLPPGAQRVRASIDGRPVRIERGERPTLELPLDAREHLFEVAWEGGLEPDLAAVDLVPGQTSRALRVIDFGWNGQAWILDVQAPSGGPHELRLRGVPIRSVDGATVLARDGDTTTLRIELPEGDSGIGAARVTIR